MTATVAALTAAVIVIWWCGIAQAYRPFDGTDAAVVDTGDVEIELGPTEYMREGSERVLFAPDLRVNYGFIPDWEATIEGDLTHALSPDSPATSLVGNIASLKTVLREGSLQQKLGPSIATELDVLLPGVRDEPGAGVGLIGIVSQQWSRAMIHLNLEAALTRDRHADYIVDTIVEGPHDWPVRPVSEFFYERDVGQFETRSGLIGAIWQVKDNIAVDFAVRGSRVNDHTAGEIRAGVTFAFGVTKGPTPLEGLAAMTQLGRQ
ncbi:MAG: hypothetical protein JO007_08200 [Alphaproteobacteria bacterium]|nr:hypothetical protein [Alphaproteobacteria bacterium]